MNGSEETRSPGSARRCTDRRGGVVETRVSTAIRIDGFCEDPPD